MINNNKLLRKCITIFMVILCINNLVGCKKTFEFPKEKDFSLKSTASAHSLLTGDKLVIESTFKNLKNTTYNIVAAEVLNESTFININIYNVDEDKIIYTGESVNSLLQGKQELSRKKEFTIDKPGKYIVQSNVSFKIINTENRKELTYNIKSDELFIDVNKR